MRKKGFSAFLLMVFVVTGLFLMCSAYMVRSYQKEFVATNQLIVDYYARQLNEDMEMLSSYTDRFSLENKHLQRLRQKGLSEFERTGEAYFLRNALENKAASLNFMAIFFYYEAETGKMQSQYAGIDKTTGKTYLLNSQLKTFLQDGEAGSVYETILQLQGENYVLHMMGVKGQYVGFLVNLDQYFKETVKTTDGEIQLLFEKKDGEIITVCQNMPTDKTGQQSIRKNISVYADLDTLNMRLVLIRPFWKIQELWKNKALWIFVVLVPIIVMIFFRILYRWFDRAMLEPVEYLLYRINQMETEETEEKPSQISEAYEPLPEFKEVYGKLDNMLDKMKRLQYEKYQKELEAQDAKIQYYKLQINPHFFLNCMNLLDSLIGKQDTATMRVFLYSLSHHFRYIFKDQADLVSLQEEMAEVQSYVNLFVIKGQEPILLQMDVKKSFETIVVPVLIVQTFIENSIKYAKEPGKILALKVSVNQIEDGEETLICIRISDNGKGYSEKILKELNQPYAGFQYHSNHVGIGNIKYRMNWFYGEKATIAFYNDTAGGAVTEILLPEGGCGDENSDHR